MDEIFRRIIDNNFSDVAGLSADVSLPVSQSLTNEILEAALRGNKTIRSCQVAFHEQNRISMRLRTAMLPWALHLRLKIDKSVDLASFSSPKMRAWLENHPLLGSLGSFLHVLPEWAKLYGNQVVIDLGYFLRSPERNRFLEVLKSVEIRTEEGRAIFDIKIEVE